MCFKRKVYEQCIPPVIMYGSETLTLTKCSVNKLRVTQRAMLKVTRRDKIKNTVIRQRTKVDWTCDADIR